MKLIICLDDNDGMLFNHRRQSRDREVCERILAYGNTSRLWMDHYSKQLFKDNDQAICCDARFLEKAGQGEYCFVEHADVVPWISRVEEILVFRWNRKYPADVRFPHGLLNEMFHLCQTEDFAGYSHEKLTLEVYTNA